MKKITTITIITVLAHLGFTQDFGIGIVPTEKLHVAGNSLVTGNFYIGATDAYFYRDQANRIRTPDQFYVDGNSANTWFYSTNTYLGNTSGDNIHLRGNELDWNTGVLTTSGDIGIGTTAPTEKLDVNGSIRIRGGSPAVGEVLVATSTDGTATWTQQPGDNLGNHSATTTLDMNSSDITDVNRVIGLAESDYDKLRVWSSSSYTIGMHSGMTMGGLGDWAMTFTMNNNVERGFLWRDVDDDQSDGAMSLTTDGHLTVKGRLDIGIDATSASDLYLANRLVDWDNPAYYLDPNGGSRLEEIQVDNGSVTDCSYFFAGDANTGFYQPADDEIGIAINGLDAIRINALSQTSFANDIYLREGSAIAGDDLVRIYDSSDDGTIDIYENNTMNIRLDGNGVVIFNNQQNNNDFRIEGMGDTYNVFVDASADMVGMGTGSPQTKLQVEEPEGQTLMLARSDAATASGAQLGGIGFDSQDGNVPDDILESSASIIAFASEAHGSGDKGGHLTFWTSPTNQNDDTPGFEGMRIEQNGEVGIGTTGPTALLSVNGDANKPGGGSWTTFSDKRIKRDVVPYGDGLTEVLQINPVKFKYIKEFAIPEDENREFVGVIAQEVNEVAPYMVESHKFDYQEAEAVSHVIKEGQELYMYNPYTLKYMLVNAIQEQQKIIEAGEREEEELLTELKELKSVIKDID